MTTNVQDAVKSAIDSAISKAGNQQKLAEKLGKGYSQQQISYWRKVGRIPAEHAPALERATGIAKHFFVLMYLKQ